MESCIKPIANPARLGPLTPLLLIMKMYFLIMFASNKRLLITSLDLDNISNTSMDLLRLLNLLAFETRTSAGASSSPVLRNRAVNRQLSFRTETS